MTFRGKERTFVFTLLSFVLPVPSDRSRRVQFVSLVPIIPSQVTLLSQLLSVLASIQPDCPTPRPLPPPNHSHNLLHPITPCLDGIDNDNDDTSNQKIPIIIAPIQTVTESTGGEWFLLDSHNSVLDFLLGTCGWRLDFLCNWGVEVLFIIVVVIFV